MKIFKIIFVLHVLFSISFAQNENKQGGKILFSKASIEKEDDASITTNFTSDDNIYALVVLKDAAKTFWSYPIKAEDFQFVFDFLDEQPKELLYSTGRMKGVVLEKRVIPFEILPDPKTITSYTDNPVSYKRFGVNDQGTDGPICIAYRLKKLPPGKQRVHVTFNLNYANAAEGDFEITAPDFKVFDGTAAKLIEGANKGAMQNAKMPEAKKSDKALEKQMIAALTNSNDWKTGFIKGKSLVKLVIIDPDWMIRRNEFTGAVLHRYIRAAAAVKDADGKCRVYQLITFQEDFIGGKFKPLKYDGVGDGFEIECDKVK
jgi:hypothetical protein